MLAALKYTSLREIDALGISMNSFHPSPFNGTIVVSAAAMTPGVFLTLLSSSRLYSRRLAVATLERRKIEIGDENIVLLEIQHRD